LIDHGFGGCYWWMLQIPEFSKYFWKVIALTTAMLEGAHRRKAYSIADMAEDTAGLMDALGSQAHILGGQWGRSSGIGPRHPR
jgi:hypothetical protein